MALVYKHKDRSFSNMRQGPNGTIPAKPIIVWLLCKVSKTSWQVSQPSAFTAEPGPAVLPHALITKKDFRDPFELFSFLS